MRNLIWSVLVATACGGGGNNDKPDAKPIDAAPDATVGSVSLTVKQGATPAANVKVYFQNPDSSVAATTMTDANGVATATMAAGGFVTAVNPFGANGDDSVFTIAGVKIGDQLEIAEPAAPPEITVTFTVPLDTTVGVTTYRVHTSCGEGELGAGGTPNSGELTLAGCNGTADVVVESQNADGDLVRAFFKPNVAVADGQTVVFTDAYAAPENATFTYTNVPAGRGVVAVSSRSTTRGTVDEKFGFAMPGATSHVATIPRPVVAGAKAQTLSVFVSQTQPDGHAVADWGPASLAYALDASILPPGFTSVPAFDFASHTFTWSASAPDLSDFVQSSITVERGATSWSWQIVAPHTGTSLVLPALPADAAMLNPATGDAVTIDDMSIIKLAGGYDSIRAKVFAEGFEAVFASATGRLVAAFTSTP